MAKPIAIRELAIQHFNNLKSAAEVFEYIGKKIPITHHLRLEKKN